ncbi:MAG: SDR family oxidoreductase [Brevinemataceae bacterium]
MNLPFKVDLVNQVAVVTGASGVLCSEIVKALAECGAKVAVCGRTNDAVEALTQEIIASGGQAMALTFDVLVKEQIIEAKNRIVSEWGKIDLLINGAGGNSPKATTTMENCYPETLSQKKPSDTTFFDLDYEGMKWVMELNLFGTVLPCQIFGEEMVKSQKGNIINISSMNAFTPLTKIPMYSAGKAAVSNFTQWLATHLAPVGIRVNAIAPGFFETQQNYKLLHHDDGSYTTRANKIILGTPMARFGLPNELIGAVLYLACDKASGFVSGINLPIDGAYSAYSGV